MAGEIQVAYGVSGKTTYALIRNSVGAIWDTSSFVAFNGTNFATYAITLTENGTSGTYIGDMPAGISSAGIYTIEARERIGGSPAQTDPVIAAGSIEWSGTAMVFQSGNSFTRIGSNGAGLTNVGSYIINGGITSGSFDEESTGFGYFATGTVIAATTDTITFQPTLLNTDDYYNGMIVLIGTGSAANDLRKIIDYDGTTYTATLDRAWSGTVTDSDQYYLYNTTMWIAVGEYLSRYNNSLVSSLLQSGITSLTSTERANIADKLLGRNLGGGSDGGRMVKDALRPNRNKVEFDIPSFGKFTVYQEDDSTVAWIGDYTRGANTLGPVVGTDPA